MRYFQAIFLQALAPLSLLLFSLFLTRQVGIGSQGAFASAKSWVDVLIVAGCFGFPQSTILAINKDGASAKWIYKAAAIYAAVLVPLFALASMVLQQNIATHAAAAISIGFGAAAAVLANIWRAVLLTIDDGIRFHLITALPTFSLIVSSSIGFFYGYGVDGYIAYFYGATALIILPAVYCLLPWEKVKQGDGKRPSLRRLVMNGSDVFVQGLSGVLQAYICLWYLGYTYDMNEVGYFSITLLFINAFAFPLQAISPMILNRWSKRSERNPLRAGSKELNLLLLVMLGVLMCVSVVLAVFPLEKYIGATAKIIGQMSVAIFILIPNISLRVDSLRMTAIGNLRFNSLVAMSKCVLFSVALVVMAHSTNSSEGAKIAMICWLLAEVVAAICYRIRVLKAQVD